MLALSNPDGDGKRTGLEGIVIASELVVSASVACICCTVPWSAEVSSCVCVCVTVTVKVVCE